MEVAWTWQMYLNVPFEEKVFDRVFPCFATGLFFLTPGPATLWSSRSDHTHLTVLPFLIVIVFLLGTFQATEVVDPNAETAPIASSEAITRREMSLRIRPTLSTRELLELRIFMKPYQVLVLLQVLA